MSRRRRLLSGNRLGVTEGLQAWYDAADSSTITSSGSPLQVSQWDDKSGNGYHVTQGTGTNQPVTGETTTNGLNVLDFVNDYFNIPSGLYSLAAGGNTVFIVSQKTAEDGAFDTLYNMRTGTTNKNFMLYSATAGAIDWRSNNAGSGTTSNTGNTNTNFQILRGRRSGVTQAVAVNGGAETTDSNGSDITGIDSAFIGTLTGAANFLEGSLAEILMYNRSLSTLEIAIVERYLSNKWGVALV